MKKIYIVVLFYLWNKKKEKLRNEINEWIRRTKPNKGEFDAFFDYDKELKGPKNETIFTKVKIKYSWINFQNEKDYQK